MDAVEQQVRDHRFVLAHADQHHVVELTAVDAPQPAAAAGGGKGDEAAVVTALRRVAVVVAGKDRVGARSQPGLDREPVLWQLALVPERPVQDDEGPARVPVRR